jgi:hypothetical protein
MSKFAPGISKAGQKPLLGPLHAFSLCFVRSYAALSTTVENSVRPNHDAVARRVRAAVMRCRKQTLVRRANSEADYVFRGQQQFDLAEANPSPWHPSSVLVGPG